MSRGKLNSLCLLVFLLLASYATHAQTTTSPRPKTSPACATRIRQAVKNGDKKAFEAFDRGFELARISMATQVSDEKNAPLKAELVVENLSGADAYRFAVAEVVKQYFPDFMVIDPTGALKIYITGTNCLGSGKAQNIRIEVEALVHHPFRTGSQTIDMVGVIKLSHHDETMIGYDEREKAQIMREMAYKVLSEFRATWTEAAAKNETTVKQ